MEWGDKVEWLQDVAEEDGEAPRALVERPDLPAHLQFAWAAFSELKTDRSEGFGGPGPVPFSAIDRYAARHGLTEIDDFERFVTTIRMLDGEYLAIIYAKIKAARSPPPANK